MVEEGTFREDLYYRLNVIEITHAAAARARAATSRCWPQHFLRKYADGQRARTCAASPTRRWRCCSSHAWPGNVRELENAHRARRGAGRRAGADAGALPDAAPGGAGAAGGRGADRLASAISIPGSTLATIEREAILRTLEAVGGSTSRAASAPEDQRAQDPVQAQGVPAAGRRGAAQVARGSGRNRGFVIPGVPQRSCAVAAGGGAPAAVFARWRRLNGVIPVLQGGTSIAE